jgi:hypothetical protein
MGEKRNNSGSINKNDSKSEPGANPNWPDYNGKCVVGGVGYWISGWVKETDGRRWMSLSFKEKDASESPVNQETVDAHDLF